MKEGNYTPYKGKPEPFFFEGRRIPGFEIFADYIGKENVEAAAVENLILMRLLLKASRGKRLLLRKRRMSRLLLKASREKRLLLRK